MKILSDDESILIVNMENSPEYILGDKNRKKRDNNLKNLIEVNKNCTEKDHKIRLLRSVATTVQSLVKLAYTKGKYYTKKEIKEKVPYLRNLSSKIVSKNLKIV